MTNLETLLNTMRRETCLFNELSDVQKELENAIHAKNWLELELSAKKLDVLGQEIDAVEALRFSSYKAACADHCTQVETSFYRFAIMLDEPFRSELTEQYRTFKFAAMKAKSFGDIFGSYLERKQSNVKEVMQELFPDSGTAAYTKKGRKSAPELKSLVINASM